MKYTVILLTLSFFAFFSSCNIFTLTGASSGTHGNFGDHNFAGGSFPPIVTSSSVGGMYTGSNTDCGAGVTITIYGANFTNDMTIDLFDTATGMPYTINSYSIVDPSEATITLGTGIPGSGTNIGVQVVNGNGSSKAFAYSSGCA